MTDLSPSRPSSRFSELTVLVRGQGLLRRRYGYYAAKLSAVALGVAALLVAFLLIGDSWWQLAIAAAAGLLLAQVAYLAHDAAHRQIFISGRRNDWASLLLGDLVVGMSYGWWRHKHGKHHANPNLLGSDPDLGLPVVPFSPERVERSRSRAAAWLMAHQGVFFFPILPLEGPSLYLASARRVLGREPISRRPAEILLLAIRHAGAVALAFWVLSPGVAVAFLAVQVGVFGFCMGATFAPNHKGMPLVPPGSRFDFLYRQAAMSRNIRGGRLVDVAMGGLNFQIEHHLFPSMPRPSLRRAAPIVADWCIRNGVPYTEVSLMSSYRTVIRYINRAGLGARDPFDCPLITARQEGVAIPPA